MTLHPSSTAGIPFLGLFSFSFFYPLAMHVTLNFFLGLLLFSLCTLFFANLTNHCFKRHPNVNGP